MEELKRDFCLAYTIIYLIQIVVGEPCCLASHKSKPTLSPFLKKLLNFKLSVTDSTGLTEIKLHKQETYKPSNSCLKILALDLLFFYCGSEKCF